MKTRSLAFLFLPVLALLGACTVVVTTYTPIGTSVAIDSIWTINGSQATPGVCATVGVEYVELWLYESPTSNVGYLAFSENCGFGGYRTDYEFADDIYFYEWVIVYADGSSYVTPTRTPLDTIGGGLFFVDVDFVLDQTGFPAGTAVSIDGGWTIDGATPSVGLCDLANIDWVEIVVLDSTQTYEYTHDNLWAYCEEGGFNSGGILAAGNYYYIYRAYDTKGDIVYETDPAPMNVPGGGTFVAPTANFLLPAIELYIELFYETGVGTGDFRSCAGAGADKMTFDWILYSTDEEDPEYADVHECVNLLYINDGDFGYLDLGTYSFDIYNPSGTPKYSALCDIEIEYYGRSDHRCYVQAIP